jgi:hypothetical protein
MRRAHGSILLLLSLLFLLPAAASAGEATYILPTPGVT